MKKIVSFFSAALIAGVTALAPMAALAQAVGLQSVIANTPYRVSGGAFNRPANTTAYAVGQLVANDTVAANVVPVQIGVCRTTSDTGALKGLRVEKSGASITNAAFRVHLFRASPTMANGDGGAFLASNGRASAEIGYFDVTMDTIYGDGAKGTVALSERVYTCPAAGAAVLYALVEARGAYTPVSGETFNVAFEVRQ